MGPFCDGVIGPITQRSGRTLWQALDQPIKTNPPSGWIQAAHLGVPNWPAISVHKIGKPKRTALLNPNSSFSYFLREGAKNEGRMDPPFPDGPTLPKTKGTLCLSATAGRKFFKKMQEHNHQPRTN